MKKLNIVSFDEAFELSQNILKKDNPKEYVPLLNALGRVLSQTITCKKKFTCF